MLTRKDKLALAGIAPPDDLTPIVPAVADDAPMPLRPEPLEKPDFMTPTVVDLHTPKPAWMVAAGLVEGDSEIHYGGDWGM